MYRRSATLVKDALASGMSPDQLFLKAKWVEPADSAGVQTFLDKILGVPPVVPTSP
jgi:hypothetical protein